MGAIETGILLLDLFLNFFTIGLFTFGGGAAMIPLLQQIVLELGWLEEADLLRYIAISESTPGPIAINMATFIGSTQAGFIGSLLATLGMVLPSFIVILLIASMFKRFAQYKGVRTVLDTIRPIVVGMILAAGTLLLFSAVGIKNFESLIPDPKTTLVNGIIVALLALVMFGYKKLSKKNISVIVLILVAAGVGVVAGYLLPLMGLAI